MIENQNNSESLSYYERMKDPNFRLREVVTTIAQIRNCIPRDVLYPLDGHGLGGRGIVNSLGQAIAVVVRGHIGEHVSNLPQWSLQVSENILLDIDETGKPTFRRHEHNPGHHDNYFDGWVRTFDDSTWLYNYQGILDQVTRLE